MRAVHGSCLTGRAGLDGLEEGGEEDAGAGVVQVSQLVVGVEVTAWRGVTGGAARRLIGNIRMESYEVAPDVSLHTTAARLGLVQGVAVVVGGLTVRTLVPSPTGGEQEAGVRERETLRPEDGRVRTILSVLAQKGALLYSVDVGDYSKDVLLYYLTGLTLNCTAITRKPWRLKIRF